MDDIVERAERVERRSNGLRRCFYFGVIVTVVPTFVAYSIVVLPLRELQSWHRKTDNLLEKVKSQVPNNVTKEEWERIVGWTQTAIPNCFYSPEYIVDKDRFRVFQEELDTRLSSKVDVSTIKWMWDQFAVLSKHGDVYAKGYRPVDPIGTVHQSDHEEEPVRSKGSGLLGEFGKAVCN